MIGTILSLQYLNVFACKKHPFTFNKKRLHYHWFILVSPSTSHILMCLHVVIINSYSTRNTIAERKRCCRAVISPSHIVRLPSASHLKGYVVGLGLPCRITGVRCRVCQISSCWFREVRVSWFSWKSSCHDTLYLISRKQAFISIPFSEHLHHSGCQLAVRYQETS